jgi:hypothetical protein
MLHSVNGFEIPFHDNASGWVTDAQARGYTVNTTPAAGAVAWMSIGHVAWVESVNSNGTVNTEDYNYSYNGMYAEHLNQAASTYQKYIHFKDLASKDATSDSIALPGKWQAGSGQGIAYVSHGSDGGFAVGIQSPNLVWQGTWWSPSPSSGPNWTNTKFIPTDQNGDGLTDLFYAVASGSPDSPGFTVGLMLNTGSGFAWSSSVSWTTTSLILNKTLFIPGKWQSGTGQGFAYVTQATDGGFAVGIQSPNLIWQGTWWNPPASSGPNFTNTRFIAADQNGDGLTDLFYAVAASSPDSSGFTVGLVRNTGSSLNWVSGVSWNASSLTLNNTRFIPGKWQSGTGQGFAYASKASDGGFSVGIQSPNLIWQGNWWSPPVSSGPNFTNTKFIPADQNGDGLTDLFYGVSTGSPDGQGFTVGLQNNTGSTFAWSSSVSWSAPSLILNQTVFMG